MKPSIRLASPSRVLVLAAGLFMAVFCASLLAPQPSLADGMANEMTDRLVGDETPESQQVATIHLSGTGHINAVADMAVVTSGVVSEARTANDALAANSRAMNDVIDAIRGTGITTKDIQTSGFSVSPRYASQQIRQDIPDAPQIVGYRVNNGLTIRVRNLNVLGTLLDAMVTNGANSIGGISFVVSKADEKLDSARTMAIADARRKADLYAAAAGAEVGRVRMISESGGFQPAPRAMAMKAMGESSRVPVEIGEETLSVTVNVVWELVH